VQLLGHRGDALAIGHIERDRADIRPRLGELLGRGGGLRAVARAEQHPIAALGELARHLSADPAVCARDQRDRVAGPARS